ncbi:hypothetical protein GE09DRAFT_1124539 [Coniochaeta sp. 2T2.1]|nr:hypothetical protein GE09DRAFT_1124539 [Coniochaeta sp. 2T2.1]
MANHNQLQFDLGQLPPDHDLDLCANRHDILAIAVEADEELSIPVTLYYWCPPTVCILTTVIISPRLLSAVKGFISLGRFFLQDGLDISSTLSELLAERTGDLELTPQLLAELMTELITPGGQGTTTPMQLFSFPVFSADTCHAPIRDGLVPVWKWAKPDSVYRVKRGFWEADLSKALDHGEWNGGRNLRLLTGEVTEEALRIAVSGDWKFASFGILTNYLSRHV